MQGDSEVTAATILRGRVPRRLWAGRRNAGHPVAGVPEPQVQEWTGAIPVDALDDPEGDESDGYSGLDLLDDAPPAIEVAAMLDADHGDDWRVAAAPVPADSAAATSSWSSLSRDISRTLPTERDAAGPPRAETPLPLVPPFAVPSATVPLAGIAAWSAPEPDEPDEPDEPGQVVPSPVSAGPISGPPAAAVTTLSDDTAAFRDELTMATATLATLVRTHRSEMAGLISQIGQLAEAVAEVRNELAAPPRAEPEPEPEPTSVEPVAVESTIVEPITLGAITPEPNPPGPDVQQLTAKLARLEIHAAAAVTAAASRIGLPKAHVSVLQQWVAHDGRSVIEVAHPGGRHRVGLAAIVYAVSTGRQVVVVVPNADAAGSWRASLAAHAPEVRVLFDDGRHRDPDAPVPHVVLSTASTTARRVTAGFEPAALLIAVDAERFGTSLLARALDERCEWRLGLAESYGRGRGLAKYADPYFGGNVLSIT